MLRACLSVFAIIAGAAAAYGQVSFAGSVVQVVDGRTIVVEASRTKVKVQLQFIETPEPDQPLHSTVREHLTKITLGKVVEFRPLRITDRLTIGRVRLAGVDLSQQLLRDGAAWHEPPATSGQPADEALDYADQQAMAKAEKRGVWSIPDLKTPWQIRAEKQAEVDRADRERKNSRPIPFAVNQFQTIGRVPDSTSSRSLGSSVGTYTQGQSRKNYNYPETNADMWVEVGGTYLSQETSLGRGTFYGYDQNRKIENISTKGVFSKAYKDKNPVGDLELRFVYFYQESRVSTGQTAYVLGLRAKSPTQLFGDDPKISFVIDGQELYLGTGSRHWRSDEKAIEELLQLKVTREDYKTITEGNVGLMKIGSYWANVSPEAVQFLRELLDLSKNGRVVRR